MQIKALQSFSYREDDGDIYSVALDEIVEMESTLANGFIADGLAEEYTGGGGESDFSTAQVTFKNADITTNAYNTNVSVIKDNGIEMDYESVLLPVTVAVPLYKGVNILPPNCITEADDSYMPTTEGSIEFDIESGGFVVTGDGSITAKGRTKN